MNINPAYRVTGLIEQESGRTADFEMTPPVRGLAGICLHPGLIRKGLRQERQETVYLGFILLLAGLPVYVWLRRRMPLPN